MEEKDFQQCIYENSLDMLSKLNYLIQHGYSKEEASRLIVEQFSVIREEDKKKKGA